MAETVSSSARAATGGAPGEIVRRLDDPADIIDVAELAAIWRQTRITFRLRGLGPLITDPGLIGRIRGAFGVRLAQSASAEALAGQPCCWSPPCAFEALWRKQGRLSPDFDHASPWVIELDPARNGLDASLVLFGFANDWRAAAAEAFCATLKHDVDWAGATGLFVPKIEIASRHVTELVGIQGPPPSASFRLDLLTPLAMTGADPRERPATLVTGLGLRLEALARWHDASLGQGMTRISLAPRARALSYQFGDCEVVRWRRGSRRQDREIHMQGLLGQLEIADVGDIDADIGLMLALGMACHIGADIAFGCGRYQLHCLQRVG